MVLATYLVTETIGVYRGYIGLYWGYIGFRVLGFRVITQLYLG